MWKLVRDATASVVKNPDALVLGLDELCRVAGSPDLNGAVEKTADSARVRAGAASRERERVGANIGHSHRRTRWAVPGRPPTGRVEMSDDHA
jgi:hypothetical protein